MISINRKPTLKQIYLVFSKNAHITASIVDPTHPDIGQRHPEMVAMDGNYYINGDSLLDATHVFTDATGAYTLQHTTPFFYNAWVGDDSGVVVKLKHYDLGNLYGSFLDVANQRTWSSLQVGTNPSGSGTQYATQYLTVGDYNGTFYSGSVGVVYHDLPDITTLTATDNIATNSQYRIGYVTMQRQAWGGSLIVDMSVVGNIKPYVDITGSEFLDIPNTIAYSILNTTNTDGSVGTFDVRNAATFGTLPQMDPLYHFDTQLDYINNTQAAGPVGTVVSSNWYSQYAHDTWTQSYFFGTMESFGYPIKGWQTPHACTPPLPCAWNSGVDGGHIAHGWWNHMAACTQHYLGYAVCCSDITDRITFNTSTPAASGGDDNGNPVAGWYRETGSSTLWTYWNGIKWIIQQ